MIYLTKMANKEKNQIPVISEQDIVFAWKAPEYTTYDRSVWWYFIAGVFVLSMVVLGILTESWPMALAFILMAGVYYLVHMDDHKDMDVRITTMGVQVDSLFIPYTDMTAFYVIYNPPKISTLTFTRHGRYQQDVTVPLEGQNPAKISAYLSSQIPELSGVQENFWDRLIRLLKI